MTAIMNEDDFHAKHAVEVAKLMLAGKTCESCKQFHMISHGGYFDLKCFKFNGFNLESVNNVCIHYEYNMTEM
jgi:hypothetical protein